jgi:hypothetical protein
MWVYTLCSIGGDLYAAIGRHAVRNLRWIGEVWRFRSGRWEQIGGEGVRNSWQLNHTNLVTSLIDYQGKLVVGYNCQDIPNDPERFGNVWAWDPGDEQWHHLGFPASCPDTAIISAQSSFNASAVWDEHLVVVGGSADPTGCATVWALSIVENKWVCLGYPSMPRPANNADVWSQDAYGYSMMIFEDDLLVGCKGAEGTAHLWRCHRKQVS